MNWITEIGIGDDQGHITTLTTLDPTGVEYTSLEFVPEENFMDFMSVQQWMCLSKVMVWSLLKALLL